MNRDVFFRIMNTYSPNIVVPGNLPQLLAWLLAEKLLMTNPNAGDLEIVATLSSEDLDLLADRILEETSRDPRWQVAGKSWFSEMARLGFSNALRGGGSVDNSQAAYNLLRERMGLPHWRQQASPSSGFGG